ncbi:MAG: LCP family protein [Acutalibacteraceae bacterium]
MNSNNDNKEKLTESNEGSLTDNGEITSLTNDSADTEGIEEIENLLEITNGEIEYPQEKVSLADVIKSAFNTDEETSEERVAEDADDEVVFVAPERIMNYVEDYLNHLDDADESDGTESSESAPIDLMYFSTGETDTLPPVHIDSDTGEIVTDAVTLDEIADEAEKQADNEPVENTDVFEDTDVSEDTEIQEYAEDEPFSAQTEDETESDAPELSFDEESAESTESTEHDEIEESENVEEINNLEETENTENTDDAEDEFVLSVDDNSEETDETDEVDLFELADVNSESDDVSIEDTASSDTDEDVSDEKNADDDEELPAIFTQGSAAAFAVPENDIDGGQYDDEEVAADKSEYESDDDENVPAITVHRHRDTASDEDESESAEYEDILGSEDMPDETEEKPSFFKRHSISAWARNKTAGGWTKFALKIAGVLLLVLCITAVLYVNGKLDLINYKDAKDFEQFYNLSDTDYVSSSDDVYENPVHYNSSTTLEGFDASMIDIPKEDVINVLLIGTDVRGGSYDDRGNTDSMILLSINTRDKNIKLTSFMRDMYVTIPGRGKNRINAAYAYGGPQLLFDTLKVNFDVDVDLYARVNFANFRKIINQVGGIEIELTQAEARYMNKYSQKYNTKPVKAGLQTLDGAQALSYARCRKIDSDFGRTERQRKVLIALVDKVKSSSLTELDSLLNTLLPMIQTNVPKMQIVSLMVDALSYLNNEVETLNVPIKNSWQSVKIRNMAVLCPNFELNKTAIVAHIYSTYKLNVENTMYQSFEVPKGDATTKRKTTSTTTASPSIAENTTTSATTSTQSTQTTTTTEKTYWWDKTTTTSATTHSSQSTTTAAPTTTTAPKTSKTQTSSSTHNSGADDDAA